MSNFQVVQQANGQNVMMLGQIVEFKGEGIGKPPGNKPWKKVVVEDMERERHTVTIRGNLPPATALNKQAQFTLSTFQGTYQGQPYTGYSGFCDVLPNYGQAAPAPQPRQSQQQYPGQQQQSPVPPYPRQQQPEAKQPNWDLINLGKCRHTLYCAVIQCGVSPIDLVADVPMLQAIEKLAGLSMNGLEPTFEQKYNIPPDGDSPAAQAEATFG